MPAVVNGRADLLASSFTITEEREEIVDFSKPYFPILAQVVVREGSDIRSIADLDGKVGAVLKGSSQERRMNEIGGVTLHYVARATDCWDVLRSGEADFAIVDSTSVVREAGKRSEFWWPLVCRGLRATA